MFLAFRLCMCLYVCMHVCYSYTAILLYQKTKSFESLFKIRQHSYIQYIHLLSVIQLNKTSFHVERVNLSIQMRSSSVLMPILSVIWSKHQVVDTSVWLPVINKRSNWKLCWQTGLTVQLVSSLVVWFPAFKRTVLCPAFSITFLIYIESFRFSICVFVFLNHTPDSMPVEFNLSFVANERTK